MREHGVFIPTSGDPLAGVVFEPDAPARGALVFFHGAGPWGRSGVNGTWTRLARASADAGVTVLRVDYPGSRESWAVCALPVPDGSRPGIAGVLPAQRAVPVVPEVISWFSRRIGALPLIAAGSCVGSRVALAAAAETRAIGELLLIGPRLRPPGAPDQAPEAWVADAVRDISGRTRVSVLTGPDDVDEVVLLTGMLGHEPQRLTAADWRARDQFRSPRSQEQLVDRAAAWVSDAVARGG